MRLFSKFIWRFSMEKKEIYLTFDDGPTTNITEFVLDELAKHNAKATFFCIGKNIQNHPEIFSRILDEKHTVGNHTQNHLNGWKSKSTNYYNNFLECEKTILNNIENSKITKLFRPPYGKLKRNQTKKILEKGYRIIMWTVLSADFDTTITKEKCLENVIKHTTNGTVIVFHDSVKASEKLKYVLPKILKHYTQLGYTFKAIK